MPIEDLNAEKMGEEMLNFFNEAEDTTAFWKLNSDFLAWIIIFVIVIALFIAIPLTIWAIIVYFKKKRS